MIDNNRSAEVCNSFECQIGIILLEILYSEGVINRDVMQLSIEDWKRKEERSEVA